MDYFMDESGYWWGEGADAGHLLVGGMVLTEPLDEISLDSDFAELMVEEGISTIHAADLRPDTRLRCLAILNAHLTDDVRVLVHVFPRSILTSASKMAADEIYIDKAARLLSILRIGDEDSHVYHDLRFYYSYPANVIRNIGALPYYLKTASREFILPDEQVKPVKQRVLARLAQHARGDDEDARLVRGYIAKINEPDDIFTERDPEAYVLEDYLWSEIWQRIQGEEKMRRSFVDRMLARVNEDAARLHITRGAGGTLRFEMLGKKINRAGLVAIDLICHLCFRSCSGRGLSSIEREVLSKVELQEFDG